jgi:hypothetical protein
LQPLWQWESNNYCILREREKERERDSARARARARVCVCVCSLRYQTCNVHASNFCLWPALLYNISPNYIIKGTIVEKKLLDIKCVV